jgi:hypothetical protein
MVEVATDLTVSLRVILSALSLSCGSIEGNVHATTVGETEMPLAFESVQIIPVAPVRAPLDSACRIFAKANAPM